MIHTGSYLQGKYEATNQQKQQEIRTATPKILFSRSLAMCIVEIFQTNQSESINYIITIVKKFNHV